VKHRILLVEDDLGWRNIIKGVLLEAQISAEIVEKNDFQKVLNSLDSDLPWDLIIADPGLPPWQQQLLGEKIIGRAYELQIPAICISGSEIPSEIESSLEKRSYLYSRKEGFDRDEFQNAVKNILKPKNEIILEPGIVHQKPTKTRNLSDADTKILISILCNNALASAIGPKKFYLDLIDDTNWPKNFLIQIFFLGTPDTMREKLLISQKEKEETQKINVSQYLVAYCRLY
jgi:CheY-like chemotaxis protein